MKFENIQVSNFQAAFRGMRNPKNSWALSDSEFGLALMNSEELKEKVLKVANAWREHTNDLNTDYVSWLMKNGVWDRGNGICEYVLIGPEDMRLAKALIMGGSEHRKFLRQINISLDITAPLFWFKEFDTYKVGTTANSTSTMHKITSAPITLDCFEIDDYKLDLQLIDSVHLGVRVSSFIDDLEQLRQLTLQYAKDAKSAKTEAEREDYNQLSKYYWKELIRWLPESWLQTRTITLNYENALSMHFQREFHKLNEWSGKENNNNTNFISTIKNLPYMEDFLAAIKKQ